MRKGLENTSPDMQEFCLAWSCIGNHSCCESVSLMIMSYIEDSISQHSSFADYTLSALSSFLLEP